MKNSLRFAGLLAFMFFFLAAGAQKTVINGVAPGAERKTIQLSTPGDLITFLEKPLATAKVDSTGHFTLSVSLAKTIYSIITIDFHKTELYLEPTKTYNVRIAPMNYDDNTEVNPFIQSQNLGLEIADTSSSELNNLIGSFNSIYSAFLMENFNALYRNRNKQLLDTFKLQLNQHFGSVENSYFMTYAGFKIASLEQLTQYSSQAQLARIYFTAKAVQYNNLEYMDFFNSFFSKYLTATSPILHKTDCRPIMKGPDPYGAMMKFMATDTLLKNVQVRELVMLKGMMELYNTQGYSQDDVLAILSTAKEKSQYIENRAVADDMITFLTKLKPGTPAPEFSLINRDQKEVSLKSMRGKPVVLCFWTTYCEGCLSEMDLIRPLYDKYKDGILFVSISADKYFSKMLRFVNLKKDYVWTFLNVGEHPGVLKDYDVRSYPLFVLIDKEGKIFKYPAGQPSSGLEADLQKILQ
ncbi:MAG: TlpA disulfide reductase family protein [Bacteroidota bacterium]